jgi:hypothetical protein
MKELNDLLYSMGVYAPFIFASMPNWITSRISIRNMSVEGMGLEGHRREFDV